MIRIALPKGRIGDKAYAIFKSAGYSIEEMEQDSRKLIFQDDEAGIQFFMAKPGDVGTYVERGAADIGVVGKDILVENAHDVYDLLNLKIGKCYMAVAAPSGSNLDDKEMLRVATKYLHTAKAFYSKAGKDIDIIKLNGSIEIAPIIGLADCIVDIVETGTTLKENNLVVTEKIYDISSRLICNKNSFRFKKEEIDTLVGRISEVVE